MTGSKFLLLTMAVILMGAHMAGAHATGENYVYINIRPESIDGQFEFHENDLKKAFGIELGEEIAPGAEPEWAGTVESYIRKNFSIGGDGREFQIEFTTVETMSLPMGRFAKLNFVMETGPVPDVLDITHTMLYETGRFHRGLLMVVENEKAGIHHGEEATAMVFGPSTSEQQLDLFNVPKALGAKKMIPQGILHIWIGLDHILFLLSLLLPAVLIWHKGEQVPAEKFSSVMWRVLKIVTLFTIAHSITLALAALDFITLSSRLVESIIALSIVLVAVNNIFWRAEAATAVMIFILGLFHGMGFASVMGELPFRMKDALKCVIGFNIGVELGQMMLVALIFPILYLLRQNKMYKYVILNGGSAVLALIASFWFAQRALGLG